MTTERDHGARKIKRLRAPLNDSNLYPSLTLALRDMRQANGRDPETGAGPGNRSWIGLALSMIVLDTLTRETEPVGQRWIDLLAEHGISVTDAEAIYALRNSVLHGYGLPLPERVNGRRVLLTNAIDAYAVDTEKHGEIWLSVPAFCGVLVERIVAEAPEDWDVASIDVNA